MSNSMSNRPTDILIIQSTAPGFMKQKSLLERLTPVWNDILDLS